MEKHCLISPTASEIKPLMGKPGARRRTAHGQISGGEQPSHKSIQVPVLRQAVGPLLNQGGQAVTTRDLVFSQINSDKGK